MKKYYSEPELEIRIYACSSDQITTSDPEHKDDNDLHKDDEFDYFG